MTANSFDAQEFEKRIIDKAQTDATYKQRLLSNPKAVFEQEIGQKLPADVEIQVLQQSMKKLYLLLPIELDELARNQALSEEQLEAVAGGSLSKALTIGGAGLLSLSILGGGSTPA